MVIRQTGILVKTSLDETSFDELTWYQNIQYCPNSYQVGEGVINDEDVSISVAVTTFVCSSRIVVTTLLPLKMMGISVDAVSVTVVTKVLVDSSVTLRNNKY